MKLPIYTVEQLIRFAVANGYADAAHHGQKRKGNGEDYVNHPIRAAMHARNNNEPFEVVIALYLHDVVEDCDFTISDIAYSFGMDVSVIVDGMTKKVWTLSDTKRTVKHNYEVERLKNSSDLVKICKMYDVYDNTTSDGSNLDKEWHKVWLTEKLEVLDVIESAKPEFAKQLREIIEDKLKNL